MKKILILMVFSIIFIACGDNSVSPEPTYMQSVQQSTYSQSNLPVTYSNTSTYISPTNTQSYISSNSSETVSYWTFEVGNVCNGYNIDISMNDKSKPVEGYYAMYQICGDRATQSYICESMNIIAEKIVNISNGNRQFGTDLVNLAKQYGAAFGFYDAIDGYLRYAYLELCYDNKALMKRQ